MNGIEKDFVKWVRPRMICHLKDDILPYWCMPGSLGTPIGHFPTFVSQTGRADLSKSIYVRMHGRQTYAYLASYGVLKTKKLLEYGLAGLRQLEMYENPTGGYYSQVSYDGRVLDVPITIQDQCYSAFPYIMAYRVTQKREYLDRIWRFIEFIDKGPYLREDGTFVNSLCPDLKTEARFETTALNIVSVIDFTNLILIPVLRITPRNEITEERKKMLLKWTKLLVDEFYGEGIFWNERGNRSDWQAKHVDLGHTSKSFGILLKATRLFREWGWGDFYEAQLAWYPCIVRAASVGHIGWRTDFDRSCMTFRLGYLQWWRHILIDQTVFHFLERDPTLVSELKNGVDGWFECEYVDRTRTCRGIRGALNSNGKCVGDDAYSKANLWKSGYHEVEHVLTLIGQE